MSSPTDLQQQGQPQIDKMDPEIMEKMLFHRSYKAPPATATQLAASTRKASSSPKVGNQNHLSTAGSSLMSPSKSSSFKQTNKPPVQPWYGTETSHEQETGEIPIIMLNSSGHHQNQDEILYKTSKQIQRQQERQLQNKTFQGLRNNSLAPPRLGRATHIERMAAARRGETYYSSAKPPRKQIIPGTTQWGGGTPAGYKPYQHVQRLTQKQQERYDRTHASQQKTVQMQNTMNMNDDILNNSNENNGNKDDNNNNDSNGNNDNNTTATDDHNQLASIHIGDIIQALYLDENAWYPAEVIDMNINSDTGEYEFDIKYDGFEGDDAFEYSKNAKEISLSPSVTDDVAYSENYDEYSEFS